MIFLVIQTATTRYRVIIHSAPLRARVRRFGRMAFVIRGAWRYSAAQIASLLMTWAVRFLKKSMKGTSGATTVGPGQKVTQMTNGFVRRFLHTIDTPAFR